MVETVIAMTQVNPNEEAALDEYLQITGALLEAAGAKIMHRYEVTETISGGSGPEYIMVVEYPNKIAIRQVFENPDYIALKTVRDKAFSQYDICIVT